MSIVQPYLVDARVLDLFAGSGALGIEALSRGAAHADFVEVSQRSLSALRDNLRTVDAGPEATVHRGNAIAFADRLASGAYDVAFADPPYRLGLAAELAEIWLRTKFAAVLGIEHEKELTLTGSEDRRAYGDTVVTFYRSS